MPNTSATGGALLPGSSPRPLFGKALNRVLSVWIAGVAGLPENMVRPRWQPEPPTIPAAGTPWCAVGITLRKAETFPYIKHVPQNSPAQSYDLLARNEEITLLCSFYDSGLDQRADEYAGLLREGVQVPQNLELLVTNSMNLIETGELIVVPSLFKDIWLYRVDLEVKIRRQIILTYPVLELLTGSIVITEDTTPPLTQSVPIVHA